MGFLFFFFAYLNRLVVGLHASNEFIQIAHRRNLQTAQIKKTAAHEEIETAPSPPSSTVASLKLPSRQKAWQTWFASSDCAAKSAAKASVTVDKAASESALKDLRRKSEMYLS